MYVYSLVCYLDGTLFMQISFLWGSLARLSFLLWQMVIDWFSSLQASIASIHMHQMDNTQL
jgi:hypothetical protein